MESTAFREYVRKGFAKNALLKELGGMLDETEIEEAREIGPLA